MYNLLTRIYKHINVRWSRQARLIYAHEHQIHTVNRTRIPNSSIVRRGSALKLSIQRLTTKSIQGAPLALERVNNIHGGDGLAAGVLGIRHRATDHVFEEKLQDTTGLTVDKTGDALHTTTASEAADGRLGDASDGVAEYLAVTLGAALAETDATLSATRHFVVISSYPNVGYMTLQN